MNQRHLLRNICLSGLITYFRYLVANPGGDTRELTVLLMKGMHRMHRRGLRGFLQIKVLLEDAGV